MPNLQQLNDAYYSAKSRVVHLKNGTVRLHGRIYRNDTQESVAGAISSGAGEEEAMPALYASLAIKRAALPAQPYEWGKVERRRAVLAYMDYNDGCTRIAIKAQEAREALTLTEDLLRKHLFALNQHTEEHIIRLGRMIAALTEEDRRAIANTSEDLYDREDSPLELDEITARLRLTGLFLNGA